MNSMERDIASEERERIANLELPLWCKAASYAEKMGARILFIAFGIGVAWGAKSLLSISIDILGRPFAALSPLDLVWGIISGIIAILLFIFAISVCFTPSGPSKIEVNWREGQANRRRFFGYDD